MPFTLDDVQKFIQKVGGGETQAEKNRKKELARIRQVEKDLDKQKKKPKKQTMDN